MDADVVVVGGGPAGCVAARLLAVWGHRVVLIDRRSSRPPLAESLPPSCKPLLETCGVLAAVDAAEFVLGAGNTVWWGEGPMRVEGYPQGATGYQVLSSALEDVLRHEAARAGARIWRPARALRAAPADESHCVEIETESGPSVLSCRWLLDASGRVGFLARGHLDATSGARTVACVGVWEHDRWPLPDASHTLVESTEWGWAWSIPVSETQRYVTAMLDPGVEVLTAAELPARYAGLLGSLRGIGPLMQDARPVASPWACDATPYVRSPCPGTRVLAVGDASSAIDPLSSFGVKKALASGWLAAVVTHTSLTQPGSTEAALDLYRAREADYVSAATRGLGALSREATPDRSSLFWSTRAALGADDPGEGEIAALRTDAAVLAAFAELRAREECRLRRTTGVMEIMAPLVRENLVVMEPHLRLEGMARPLRYIRSVDLVALRTEATYSTDVGELYVRWNATHGDVPLPDFLGALSVLIGKRALEFA